MTCALAAAGFAATAPLVGCGSTDTRWQQEQAREESQSSVRSASVPPGAVSRPSAPSLDSAAAREIRRHNSLNQCPTLRATAEEVAIMCRRQSGTIGVQDLNGDIAASCYVGGFLLCSALLVRERVAVVDVYVEDAQMTEWFAGFVNDLGQPAEERIFGGVRHYFWTDGNLRIGLSLSERGVRVRAALISEVQQP